MPIEIVRNEISESAIKLLEDSLARAKSGEVIAVAVVEVRKASTVSAAWSKGGNYHQLNSGAARLAAHLATVPDDG